MDSFFSRYKNALVLMLVLLAQVVLLAMQVRRPAPDMPDGHNVRLWRYWVASAVTPPERLAHNTGLNVRGIWTNYIDLRRLREQNQDLQSENDRLRLEQASLAEDARDGERLREMLDFRGQYIDKTMPAQVIGTSGTDQAHVIYIDKGYKDGLRTQMPVITPDGVVGKIKNVFPSTAQVLLISDQTSGAGVMLQSTRIRGVMKGDASGQPQMVNISPDDRIQPGEEVLTSGGDQVYPRGLPVGVVEKVVSDPDTSYVNVLIKPNANLGKLEEVLVVTEIVGKMPFTQEKDLLQSEVDALAEKQRAADILSEKLPSLQETDINEAVSGDDTAAAGGDPARPVRPPTALHPDRFTPGAAPQAAALTPGEAPPITHRAPTVQTDAMTHAAPRTAEAGAETAAGREAAPTSRFPPKPAVTPRAAAGASLAAELAAGSRSNAGLAAAKPVGVSTGRTVQRTAGSGIALPLQPADSAAAARRAAAASAEGGLEAPATAVRSSYRGDGSSPGPGTNGTPNAAVARAPRPAAAGSAAGGAMDGSARAMRPATTPNSSIGGSGRVPGTAVLTTSGVAGAGSAPRSSTAAGTAGGMAAASSARAAANSGVPATRAPLQTATGKGNLTSGSTMTRSSAGLNRPGETSQPSASSTRRIVLPADGGGSGILTPAGMGLVGSTPRPKAPAPAGSSTPPANGARTGSTVKPASAKPPVTGAQASPATRPQKAPSAAPPGGA